MDWTSLDWNILDRLRDRFLQGSPNGESYWTSSEDLAHYDATYAVRIGWKWEAVLAELKLRGWHPPTRSILDFGCGSGIAGRRILRSFSPGSFDELLLWDQSALAMDFAESAATRAFPDISVAAATPGLLAGESRIGLLVVSHVLNELTAEGLALLRRLLLRSTAVLWVEPGTRDVARGLQLIRDELKDAFTVIAPCTHQSSCPLNSAENERHWCHFFAPPPSEIFADGNWVKFGQRAGIDLRSLPYCFLALQKRDIPAPTNTDGQAPLESLSHIIGRPEALKPYLRLLDCSANGARELRLPKRANAALFKQVDRAKFPLVASWQCEGSEIRGGKLIASPSAENDKTAE